MSDSLASPRGRRKAFQSAGLSVGIQQWEIDEHVKTGRVKIRKVCVRKRPMAIGQSDAADPLVRAAHSVPLRARSPTISFPKLEASPLIAHLSSSARRKHAFSLSRGLSLGPRGPPLSLYLTIICAFPLALA